MTAAVCNRIDSRDVITSLQPGSVVVRLRSSFRDIDLMTRPPFAPKGYLATMPTPRVSNLVAIRTNRARSASPSAADGAEKADQISSERARG
jgi:hypothetical protein